MVSKGMENVIKLLKKFQDMTKETTVESTRKGLEQMGAMSKVPDDIRCEKVEINGIEGEWIIAREVKQNKVLLYLHGGAFIAGSINTHKDLISRISRAGRIKILAINYRLAPEHPFPAALEDTYNTYQWLISEKNYDPKDIIIGGDSAGGNLTLATLIKIKKEGFFFPAAAFCLSPATDMTGSGESYTTKADIDPFLTPDLGELVLNNYLKNADPENPLVSPLYADLEGLPPIYIQVGTSEILFDDSIRIAEKLEDADVEVELDVWEDMIHVFAAFAAFAPESREAIKKIGHFIERHT
ncbi:MAG: Esterase MY09-1 [Promethearchaeota archaeon]|nr:MAG: Esterase MY09-1 [Candidatus Lokiarchaeota archaeon]